MKKWATQFNLLGELRNEELERAYRAHYADTSRGLIGIISLAIGCIYLALLAFDIQLVHRDSSIPLNVTIRGGIFLLSIGMAVLSKKAKAQEALLHITLGFFILTVLSYQLLLYVHREPNFMDQAMGFLLIAFAAFIIPNRWINNLLFSIGVTVMFFLIVPRYAEPIESYRYYGALIYFIMAICIASGYSFYLHVYRRVQYVRGMRLEESLMAEGVPNIYSRLKFVHIFRRWIQRARLGGTLFSVVMFDLDGFKRLNDTMGHEMGDKILMERINEMSSRLRANDIFARWGGEEFMVLLPEIKLSEAELIAERLRREIEEGFKLYGLPITASFGVTQYKSDDTVDTMVHRLDVHMHAAKEGGKNTVRGDSILH